MSWETRGIGRHWRVAMLRISVLFFVGVMLAGALQAQSFTQFPAGGAPFGITAGPDGNLWFTENAGNRIGRITPSGVITEFPIPTPNSAPEGITRGSDGNLWFTETDGNKIGRITPAGAITEFSLTTPISGASHIAAGADGNIWFTEAFNTKIGRITPAGAITEFTVPTGRPEDLTAGPDGNIWFTERLENKVGRITPGGVITEFTTLTMSRLLGITAASDGNLWFVQDSGGKIGRITTSGVVSEFNLPPTAGCVALTTGSDGNIWCAEQTDHAIARITTSAVVTEFAIPSSTGLIQGIAKGPDGNIWFTDSGGTVGRFSSGLCTSSATNLCLNNGRFRVSTAWQTTTGSGIGNAVSLTSDTGYFWFFSPNNVEMVIKVVNGCSFNSNYWTFAGGLTDVNVTMTVTDTQTGTVKTYVNPRGIAFQPIQDTSAFATCP